MLHYIHYGELRHIKQFFIDGSIQIGTLRTYDTETHGQQIGDDDEGLSFCALTDQVVEKFLGEGREIPPHLMQAFGPDCQGNFVSVTNVSFNYAMFCVSRVLHSELCKNFKSSYDAAIYIERPFPFFTEITKSFEKSGLAESVLFQHVADIDYRSRQTEGPDDLAECFVKDKRYQHQAETRAIWNAGSNPPKYFRFKSPGAIRCCRPVLLADMPTYPIGATAEIVNSEVIKAINACTKENYL
jgi:hypothetical protein